MSKAIPSLTSLVNQVAADIKSKLGLVLALVVRLVVDALASVLGAQFYLAYLYMQDIENNLFPDTADTEANGGTLERFGRLKLRRMPFPATDGLYTATVSGVTGSVIRAGLTFKSSDTSNKPGNLYITDVEYILPGSTGVINLRSLDAGPDYLLNIGDALTATEPVIGLNQTINIASIVTLPKAAETEALYRKKVLDSYILEPQGGARTDYRLWADDAQGVERVYPYVKNGDAGTIQIFVEATELDSTDGHGTPSGAFLNEVKAVIEFDPDDTLPTNDRGRRPMQAIPEVLPITIKPVDVDIITLQTDTSAIRASIRTNLETYLFGIRPYIAGADLPRDKNDILTMVRTQSVVSDTIGNTNTFLNFRLYVDGVVVNTFTFSLSDIPYLRNVNYL